MTRLKSVVLMSVLALPLCGITGAAVGWGRDELEPPREAGSKGQASKDRPKKKEAAKPADDIAAIHKARLDLAKIGYENAVELLGRTKRSGNVLVMDGNPEDIYTWSVRLLQAEREMKPKRADQIAALEAHLKRMTELHKRVEALARDLLPHSAKLDADWHRLEAELWLAEAKAK